MSSALLQLDQRLTEVSQPPPLPCLLRQQQQQHESSLPPNMKVFQQRSLCSSLSLNVSSFRKKTCRQSFYFHLKKAFITDDARFRKYSRLFTKMKSHLGGCEQSCCCDRAMQFELLLQSSCFLVNFHEFSKLSQHLWHFCTIFTKISSVSFLHIIIHFLDF